MRASEPFKRSTGPRSMVAPLRSTKRASVLRVPAAAAVVMAAAVDAVGAAAVAVAVVTAVAVTINPPRRLILSAVGLYC